MTRLSIEITAPAPDDFMSQATILVGCKAELEALTTKLESLGVKPSSNAGFVREVTRKPKASATPPGPTPIEQAINQASPVEPQVGPDSVTLPPSTAHGRRHAAAAGE